MTGLEARAANLVGAAVTLIYVILAEQIRQAVSALMLCNICRASTPGLEYRATVVAVALI